MPTSFDDAMDKELKGDILDIDRIMTIFKADLRRRSLEFDLPADPLIDAPWLLLFQRTYADPLLTRGK